MSMRDSSVIGYDVLSTLNTLAIPETVYPVTGFANDYQLSLTSLLVSLSVAVQASNNRGMGIVEI
jgi:hypothetical protein